MFQHQIYVEFGDTDAAGIVYYPNYYKWMDNAAHAFFHHLGFSTRSLLTNNIATPLIEAHCTFKQPAFFHEMLTVEVSVTWLKEKVFQLQYEMIRGDQIIAHGYEIRAYTTFENHQPKAIPIPNDFKQALQTNMIKGAK